MDGQFDSALDLSKSGYVGDDDDDPKLKYQTQVIRSIRTVTTAYKQYEQMQDNVNLAYWRGKGWNITSNGGAVAVSPSVMVQRSTQDEIYPAIDQMKSSMAMSTPQCSASDRRYNRTLDPVAYRKAQIVASTLCWHADKDKLGIATASSVLNAFIFDRGGIVKVFPDAEAGIIRSRVLEPWEIHFDPRAKRLDDVKWAVETMVISLDDFNARVADGTYKKPEKQVSGDTVSVTLSESGQEQLLRQDMMVLKQQPWQEVTIYEWRDFSRGILMHVIAQTDEIVMEAPVAYGNPYHVLIFDEAVGALCGVSIVSRMVTLQRDLNEETNIRLEVARRCFAKLFLDRAMFQDDEEYNMYLAGKPWEVVPMKGLTPGVPMSERFYIQPAAALTEDFHNDVKQRTEHIRFLAGSGAFRQAGHFRTAEEVTAVTGAIESRMEARMQQVISFVHDIFQTILRVQKWMLQNPKSIKYDPQACYLETVGEAVSFEEWQDAIQNGSNWLKLEPFAPLMENAATRRQSMERIVGALGANAAMAPLVNWAAVLEEIVKLYHFNPAVATPPAPPPGGAPPGAAPGMPGLPPTGAPAMPPGMPVPGEAGAAPGAVPGTPQADPNQMIAALMGSPAPQ